MTTPLRNSTLAAAAVLGALLGLPAAGHATWGGNAGRIAYSSLSDDENGRVLHTVRPDGSRSRLVQRGASEPSWSADGRRLVYLRNGSIWRSSATGRHRHKIVPVQRIDGVAFKPSWSPDGLHVVFHSVREEQRGASLREFNEIWTVRADGSRLRKRGAGGSPVWAPDGRHIAFARGSGAIVWMRPGGGHKRALARPTGYSRSLDFSPDGRRLVYQNGDTIQTLDVRTGKVRSFPSRRAGNPVQVLWTPSGRRIAYLQWDSRTAGPWPPSEIRTIKPNGHGRRNLLTVPEELLPFEFSWQAR